MSKRRDAGKKLTRWNYFVGTLYRNAAKEGQFEFNGVFYNKSDELMDIDEGNTRINMCLVFALFAMFGLASKFQQIWIVLVYFVIVIAGQLWRLLRLPKSMKEHLTDSGRRAR